MEPSRTAPSIRRHAAVPLLSLPGAGADRTAAPAAAERPSSHGLHDDTWRRLGLAGAVSSDSARPSQRPNDAGDDTAAQGYCTRVRSPFRAPNARVYVTCSKEYSPPVSTVQFEVTDDPANDGYVRCHLRIPHLRASHHHYRSGSATPPSAAWSLAELYALLEAYVRFVQNPPRRALSAAESTSLSSLSSSSRTIVDAARDEALAAPASDGEISLGFRSRRDMMMFFGGGSGSASTAGVSSRRTDISSAGHQPPFAGALTQPLSPSSSGSGDAPTAFVPSPYTPLSFMSPRDTASLLSPSSLSSSFVPTTVSALYDQPPPERGAVNPDVDFRPHDSTRESSVYDLMPVPPLPASPRSASRHRHRHRRLPRTSS